MKKKIALIISLIIVLVIVGMIVLAAYTSSESYRKKKTGETIYTEQIDSSPSSEQVAQKDESAYDEMPRLEEAVFYDLGLTMKAKDVSNVGLTLVFTQSGGNPSGDLETGSDFTIEINVNGSWETLPLIIPEDEMAWTAEAYDIAKDCTLEMDINWSNVYGELVAGNYRIKKTVLDFRGPGDYDTYEVYAEFMVE